MNMLEGNGTNSVLRARKVSLGFGLLAAAAFLLAATVHRRRRPSRCPRWMSCRPMPPSTPPCSATASSSTPSSTARPSQNSRPCRTCKWVWECTPCRPPIRIRPLGKFEAARRDPESSKSFDFPRRPLFRRDLRLWRIQSSTRRWSSCKALYGAVYFGGFTEGLQRRTRRAPDNGPKTMNSRAGSSCRHSSTARSHQVPRTRDWFQGQRQGRGEGTAGPSGIEPADVAAQAPFLQNRLKRTTVGGHSYLTLHWTARWSPGTRGSWRKSAPWPRLPTTAIS